MHNESDTQPKPTKKGNKPATVAGEKYQAKDERKEANQNIKINSKKRSVEIAGFEPAASHMRSERSTTELNPQPLPSKTNFLYISSIFEKQGPQGSNFLRASTRRV